jgi:glycerophosphoryl diester phosphodiesterase
MYWLLPLLIIAAILAFLYLFLIAPTLPSKSKKYIRDVFHKAKVAHRGLHTEKIPENSLAAYQNAIDNGFAIEIDVHITKDGNVVVFHDDDLKRMCGVEAKIEDLTLEEIKNLKLLNTDQKIPTFKEVLELVGGRVPLLIEIKSWPGKGNKLCELTAKELDEYKGDFAIQSFDPFSVQWFRKNRKDVYRGQLSGALEKKNIKFFLLQNLLIHFISRPDFVSYQFDKTNIAFNICVKLFGAASFGWTVRSQKDREEAEKHVDTIIFEGFLPK